MKKHSRRRPILSTLTYTLLLALLALAGCSNAFTLEPPPTATAPGYTAKLTRQWQFGMSEDRGRHIPNLWFEVQVRHSTQRWNIRAADIALVRSAGGATIHGADDGSPAIILAEGFAADEPSPTTIRHASTVEVPRDATGRFWVHFVNVRLAYSTGSDTLSLSEWPAVVELSIRTPDGRRLILPVADPRAGSPIWKAPERALIASFGEGVAIIAGRGYGALALELSAQFGVRWRELDVSAVGLGRLGLSAFKAPAGGPALALGYAFGGAGPVVGFSFHPGPFVVRPAIGYVIGCVAHMHQDVGYATTPHQVFGELDFLSARRSIYPFVERRTVSTWGAYVRGTYVLGSFSAAKEPSGGSFSAGLRFRGGS